MAGVTIPSNDLKTTKTKLIVLEDSLNPLVKLKMKIFNENEIEGVVSEIVRSEEFNSMLNPSSFTDGVVPFSFKVGQSIKDTLLNDYGKQLQTTYSVSINRFIDGIDTPLV
jgi:hypothetical protein